MSQKILRFKYPTQNSTLLDRTPLIFCFTLYSWLCSSRTNACLHPHGLVQVLLANIHISFLPPIYLCLIHLPLQNYRVDRQIFPTGYTHHYLRNPSVSVESEIPYTSMYTHTPRHTHTPCCLCNASMIPIESAAIGLMVTQFNVDSLFQFIKHQLQNSAACSKDETLKLYTDVCHSSERYLTS